MGKHGENVLGQGGAPLVFEATGQPAAEGGLASHGYRMIAWSLSGFQKVAVVSGGAEGRAWRLASDEGPNLNGWDAAPPPLGFLSVGLAAAYAAEIRALAELRGMALPPLQIGVDNFYSVTGRMRDKNMHGGALPFIVALGLDLSDPALLQLVTDALHVAPVSGLVRQQTNGAFRVLLNGNEVPLNGVAPLRGKVVDDPLERCVAEPPAKGAADLLAQDGWSRKSDGKAPLHVTAAGAMAGDGTLRLHQELRAPCGSAWSVAAGGPDAPDALAHVSAGIGFCFMTQLEILADMHGVAVQGCRLVQDTAFGPGGAQSGTGKAPGFAPVETHLFVTSDSATPAEIAELVDLAERACYLHALCRTGLKPSIRHAV